MSDDWLDKFNVGNTNFDMTCRIAGGVIFVVSGVMVSMLIFKWGLYGLKEYKNVVPSFIYYIPIPAVIGSIIMMIWPGFFKPREKNPDA